LTLSASWRRRPRDVVGLGANETTNNGRGIVALWAAASIQLQHRREIYEIGMPAASMKKQWQWHLRCNKMTDGSPLIVRCIVEHGSATNYKWRKQVLPRMQQIILLLQRFWANIF
jgi:hypothetical protein